MALDELEQALEYDIRIETTDTPESAASRKIMDADGVKPPSPGARRRFKKGKGSHGQKERQPAG